MSEPIDPSPTPEDYGTWGFYCDSCKTFFDLLTEGKVLAADDNVFTCYHKCGAQSRYIGYVRQASAGEAKA